MASRGSWFPCAGSPPWTRTSPLATSRPARVEEIERRRNRPRAGPGLLLVLVDMVAGFELRDHLQGHRVAGLRLGRIDGRRQLGGPGLDPGLESFFLGAGGSAGAERAGRSHDPVATRRAIRSGRPAAAAKRGCARRMIVFPWARKTPGPIEFAKDSVCARADEVIRRRIEFRPILVAGSW